MKEKNNSILVNINTKNCFIYIMKIYIIYLETLNKSENVFNIMKKSEKNDNYGKSTVEIFFFYSRKVEINF